MFHEINANTPPLTQELPKIMNFTVLQTLETELLGIKEIPVLGEFWVICLPLDFNPDICLTLRDCSEILNKIGLVFKPWLNVLRNIFSVLG